VPGKNTDHLHNPNFKPLEFEGFKNAAGSNRFFMSPKKWVEATHAIGIFSRSGRYGGGIKNRDSQKFLRVKVGAKLAVSPPVTIRWLETTIFLFPDSLKLPDPITYNLYGF
jgi:hypothetical protein